MDILEWSISARDPFIYFAMCLSIPSLALYIAEIDVLYVLNSFYGYRLPILFGSVMYPVYSLLPNWMIDLAFFLTGYTLQANSLATAFILLNRLTAISVPLKHEKLWRKFLPLVAIIVFCMPICTNWVLFKSEGILQKENPNSTDQSLLLYEAGDAPYMNYLNYMDAASSVIFMSVCILINIGAFVAYKWHKKKFINPDSSDQLERKLFIYALATFSGHALIACLFIGVYIATNSQNMPMAMAMYAHYPWVLDTGCVVISSWLLLWAGASFRQQLLKDYRIPRIRCETRANNRKKKNFLSLTAHYIDEGFERKWKVLSTEPMNEAHTGQNIRQSSSMISATDELNVENFDCFCHKLNLALSDGLEHRTKSVPEIKKEIQMCRELVGFYNRSKNFQNVLRRQQDLIDAPKTGLIQDVITRWNSTLYMVDRIIQQQRALSLAQIDFPELKLPNFELLKNLSAVLAPFDKFTKQLSNRDESISSVLPIYRCLLTMLNEKCTDSDPMKLFKKIVVNGLKTRMAKYECKRFLVIATLIDPRYKNHPNIFSLEDRFQNKVLLKTEVELFINPSRRFSDSDSNNGPVIQHSDNPMANFLFTDPEFSGAILSQNDSTENEIGQEIDSFFKTSTIASDTNPLEFWRHNTTYPHIKQIVPKFLCPPPGSVDIVNIFLDEFIRPNCTSKQQPTRWWCTRQGADGEDKAFVIGALC
uniref:Serpentine receptor class gamma n=1 Tax=Globodera rostochiensis TaxID=31243 RepID=A0A914I286_GLORO